MAEKIDHIAIAVNSIEEARKFYEKYLHLKVENIETVESQGVKVAFIPIGDTKIELLEPLSENSPISKFLQKRGEGIHHLCFQVKNIEKYLEELQRDGVKLIDKKPKVGAGQKKIAFVHPKSNSGVLTELAEKIQPGERPLTNLRQLREIFEQGYKDPSQWKLGIEYEVSGVYTENLEPIPFIGERSIEAILLELTKKYGENTANYEAGHCLGLNLPYGKITLEPGGQIEISLTPHPDLQSIAQGIQFFLTDLCLAARPLNIDFYAAGVDPFSPIHQRPWSPKPRYKIMREYLQKQGSLAHTMMKQTMSIQINIDYSDENDAIEKYQLARHLQPTLLFLSSNSKIYNREVLQHPFRKKIWLNTDDDRCGIPPQIENFDQYIQYALDVPMFFIERNGQLIKIADGKTTFRKFLEHGFGEYTPLYRDWELHITTLFPEVRFKKSALELRMFDANLPSFTLGLIAAVKGIFYNREARKTAQQLQWTDSWEDAKKLIDLAEKFLGSEREFLNPLKRAVEKKKTPGDEAVELFLNSQKDPQALFKHLRLCRELWLSKVFE